MLDDTAAIGAIWDLDGTLADTEQAHFRAWQVFCKRHGRDLTWDEFKPTFGLGNGDILHMLLSDQLSEAEIARMSSEKEATFREVSGGVIAPMPGARQLVAHLHEIGVRQAIGSSAPPENIAFVLAALELESQLRTTVSRWEVEDGKPAPDIFLLAAEKLGIAANRCFVLEDAPPGLQAARAAGMRCIALASTWPETALGSADLIVRDLQDVVWDRDTYAAFVEQGLTPGR